jgi:hypothetical protein
MEAADRATLNSEAATCGIYREEPLKNGFGFSNGNSDSAGGSSFPAINLSTGKDTPKTDPTGTNR